MRPIEIRKLADEIKKSAESYNEIVRAPDLSCGLYFLPKGSRDSQEPHTEDEIYYVIEGAACIRVGNEDLLVHAGNLVHVEALVEHRFHDITEDLVVLVFFAPAEYSRGFKKDAVPEK